MAEAATTKGGFMWMEHEKIDPAGADSYIAKLPTAAQAEVTAVYKDRAPEQAGRDVLRFAMWFPGLLFVAFGLIALWFKARGGYKPIELQAGKVSGH